MGVACGRPDRTRPVAPPTRLSRRSEAWILLLRALLSEAWGGCGWSDLERGKRALALPSRLPQRTGPGRGRGQRHPSTGEGVEDPLAHFFFRSQFTATSSVAGSLVGPGGPTWWGTETSNVFGTSGETLGDPRSGTILCGLALDCLRQNSIGGRYIYALAAQGRRNYKMWPAWLDHSQRRGSFCGGPPLAGHRVLHVKVAGGGVGGARALPGPAHRGHPGHRGNRGKQQQH